MLRGLASGGQVGALALVGVPARRRPLFDRHRYAQRVAEPAVRSAGLGEALDAIHVVGATGRVLLGELLLDRRYGGVDTVTALLTPPFWFGFSALIRYT